MSKQKQQLRCACNLEVDNVKTDEEKLIAYAYYEDMLNAIGETNERAFTKRRRIMKRKLEKKRNKK
tara:strand:- start:98 stop:295 length:198 start_codon:yes stop_codon:yes gene_type:complete